MQTGIYKKILGRTGVGMYYEFDCLSRHHVTGVELVTYVPLRIEPGWTGPRHCTLERDQFEEKFIWVSEGLPVPG